MNRNVRPNRNQKNTGRLSLFEEKKSEKKTNLKKSVSKRGQKPFFDDEFQQKSLKNVKSKTSSLKKYFKKDRNVENYSEKPFKKSVFDKISSQKPFFKKRREENSERKDIRLNRYIANAGICSRRDADIYISSGNVSVNNKIITELGYRVKSNDVVRFDDKIISAEKKEYILLNKPKGFITTTDDEKGRKTVMDLVANATNAKIKPVGRLDRATTGLLLLTNDGDLADKLTHPSFNIRKIYHVILDKKLQLSDFHKIQDGLTLEDGFIQVDEVNYVENAPRNEIGVKIHSGRNRIVRRIFEHLGYQVEKLDRVSFAGLTKKDLPRGHWRHLTEQEIINLKNSK